MNAVKKAFAAPGVQHSSFLMTILVSCLWVFYGCEVKEEGTAVLGGLLTYVEAAQAEPKEPNGTPSLEVNENYIRKINFVYSSDPNEHLREVNDHDTPSPRGWETYDGSRYTLERGYGWLIDLYGYGRDRGTKGRVVLADGTITSPEHLGRPELANFQGKHNENELLVFRIDVPDGWYRVSCASVDPSFTAGKPLVDQRTFKCRAHDVVFAGANYGAPVLAGGRQLIEGDGIVEATNGHLRIVVGDAAYAGWTWDHPGPWNKGWRRWWYNESRYANGWLQVLGRRVDPGFHFLTLNSLEIERVPAPRSVPTLIFRDYFNRDDAADINAGIAPTKHWGRVRLHARIPDSHDASLDRTAIRFAGPPEASSVTGFLQQHVSPANGVIRYSTRVSLFTGAGSRKGSGTQEAGIVLLVDAEVANDFNSTFVGIKFDGKTTGAKGAVVYRVGDGRKGFRTHADLPDHSLPLRITEGEYEIVVEHDVSQNILRRIQVNGIDFTDRWSEADRTQRVAQGRFGLRSAITNDSGRADVRQYYWFYRVEAMR